MHQKYEHHIRDRRSKLHFTRIIIAEPINDMKQETNEFDKICKHFDV